MLHCRRSGAAAEALAAEHGERAIVVTGDLARPRSPSSRRRRGAFGRLDVWVNNAGVQPVAGLLAMAPDEFAAVVEGNLGDGVPRDPAAARADGRRRGDRQRGVDRGPAAGAGHSHYAAAKAAVVAHTRAAALELGRSGCASTPWRPG